MLLDPQSLNRYEYSRNDPCNQVDPLGLSSTCIFNVSINNQVGLTNDQLTRIEDQIQEIFGQSDDGHGNEVAVNFIPSTDTGDATLTFKNATWYNHGTNLLFQPVRGGATSCPYFGLFGCKPQSSEVYVNTAQDHFGNTDYGDRGMGSLGAHELFHGLTGEGHVNDDYNLMGATSAGIGLNGNPPDGSTNNVLTEEQISELFKNCQKLHPPKPPGNGNASSGGGGGWDNGGGSVSLPGGGVIWGPTVCGENGCSSTVLGFWFSWGGYIPRFVK